MATTKKKTKPLPPGSYTAKIASASVRGGKVKTTLKDVKKAPASTITRKMPSGKEPLFNTMQPPKHITLTNLANYAADFMRLPDVQTAIKREATNLAEKIIKDAGVNTGYRPGFERGGETAVNQRAEVGTLEQPALRTQIMAQANTIITRDRAATHGKAEDSFQIIANYWNVYLTKKLGIPVTMTPMDISQFMTLFKIARIHNNPGHKDNWLDQVGYSAIGAELALKQD